MTRTLVALALLAACGEVNDRPDGAPDAMTGENHDAAVAFDAPPPDAQLPTVDASTEPDADVEGARILACNAHCSWLETCNGDDPGPCVDACITGGAAFGPWGLDCSEPTLVQVRECFAAAESTCDGSGDACDQDRCWP